MPEYNCLGSAFEPESQRGRVKLLGFRFRQNSDQPQAAEQTTTTNSLAAKVKDIVSAVWAEIVSFFNNKLVSHNIYSDDNFLSPCLSGESKPGQGLSVIVTCHRMARSGLVPDPDAVDNVTLSAYQSDVIDSPSHFSPISAKSIKKLDSSLYRLRALARYLRFDITPLNPSINLDGCLFSFRIISDVQPIDSRGAQ